jgi:ACS family tartrate transporter-like MFS transporter
MPHTIDVAAVVSRIRRRLVPFLFLLYIFAYLDRINVGFAALQMNEALGFSAATYAFGAGIFFVSYFLFEIPSNVILARVGARRWIARIMITWGLVSASMMFVRSASAFYALRFLLGLAEAGFFPGIIYYLTRWVPAHERAQTIAAFITAVLIAGVIGGPISGALLSVEGAGLAGWQWLFLLEGLPAILLGFVVLRVLPDGPEDARWLSEAEARALVARLDDEARSRAPAVHTTAGALTNGRVWLLAAVYFTIPVALYALGFFLPQIIRASFGGSNFAVGLLSAIPYIVGVAGMLLVGRHSDRTGERRWHVAIAGATCGAGFIATAFVHGTVPAIVAISIAMLGLASMFGPFWTLATSFTRGMGAAAGIALINSVGNLGGFAGPYALGYIKDATESFSMGLLLIGGVMIAGGALVLLVPRANASD